MAPRHDRGRGQDRFSVSTSGTGCDIVPIAYAKEATTTAIVPDESRPAVLWSHAREDGDARDLSRSRTDQPVDFSAGRKWIARAATKIGTLALAIAAAPESLRLAGRDERERDRGVDGAEDHRPSRSSASRSTSCEPWRATSNPMSGIADRGSRKPIVVVGPSSSTATLMNMKEEPTAPPAREVGHSGAPSEAIHRGGRHE